MSFRIFENAKILILLACAYSPTATPRDFMSMSLEELLDVEISSSSFFSLPANKSPGSSWLFTHEEINNSPITHLKDIFEFYTPAIAVSPAGFSGATLGVRGIGVSDNSKTMFMVDGQNINQRSLYGYQAGMQSVLFGDINYLEVVNGPGAILHGSGAINNMINIIPKNGAEFSGLHSNAQYGVKDELLKLDIEYGHSYGANKNYFLYAGVAHADGFKPESFLEQGEPGSPILDPSIDTQRPVFEIPLHYRFAGYFNHDDLEFQTQLQRIRTSFNKASGVNDADVWRGYWQTYWVSRIKYNWQLNDNRYVQFTAPFEFYDHGLILNSTESKKGGRESHHGLQAIFHQDSIDHKFAIGTGLDRRNFDAQKQYFEKDKLLLEESLNGDLVETKFFLEDIWLINDQWTVSLGLRYDDVNYGDFYEPETMTDIFPDDLSATTKRVATSYQINQRQTIKASYQEGFRYPDVSYFLTLGIANAALNNASLEPLPDLKEETVKSYEITYLHKPKDTPLNWDINFYYNIHENTLSWVRYTEAQLGTARYNTALSAIGFGPGSYANAPGKFKAYGSELKLDWQPDDDLTIRTSYAFSRPSDIPSALNTTLTLVNESGDDWASYPEHLFKLAANWDYSDKLHINLTTYYSPSVDVCVSNCATPTDSVLFHEKDRIRFNSRIDYTVSKQARLSFIIKNIFENNGPPVGFESREGPGREGGLGDDSQMIYVNLDWEY